jgi:hypothetical protein
VSVKRRPKQRDPILIEVIAALGAGGIREAFIEAHDAKVAGYCEGGRVTVNPIFDTVDTLIHELLHRLRPRWTERGVATRTRRLMNTLSDREVARIYELYQGIKTTRKKPIPWED